MLGEEIADPDGVESRVSSVRGLGLLPARTRLTREKTTRSVSGQTPSGVHLQAYEIHMGITVLSESQQPFAILDDGTTDGIRCAQVVGTYLHGAFENKAVLEELLGCSVSDSPLSGKQVQYDRLADWFAAHVDHGLLSTEYLSRPSISAAGLP